MSTIHFHRSTVSPPEQFIAGLTDFGPGHSELSPTAVLGTRSVRQDHTAT
jgi:hypothetical protein